ncbi:hypothetical protein HOLleu_32883 [Holothuria leucospilota]|uniref:Uncharacterized protein n=1 Tax=Holothuria leucospilota TaxID=206669 RepID=A0A9Q0YMR3_HOLLE|nr:hypothetical protein HOLleu_32883 [Holothuria leucospilota]
MGNKGKQELDHLFSFVYNFHNSIKLTIESSTMEIPFLDVRVMIKNGRLETSVYSKPTDRHAYMFYCFVLLFELV